MHLPGRAPSHFIFLERQNWHAMLIFSLFARGVTPGLWGCGLDDIEKCPHGSVQVSEFTVITDSIRKGGTEADYDAEMEKGQIRDFNVLFRKIRNRLSLAVEILISRGTMASFAPFYGIHKLIFRMLFLLKPYMAAKVSSKL
jgi:hypothetical protein